MKKVILATLLLVSLSVSASKLPIAGEGWTMAESLNRPAVMSDNGKFMLMFTKLGASKDAYIAITQTYFRSCTDPAMRDEVMTVNGKDINFFIDCTQGFNRYFVKNKNDNKFLISEFSTKNKVSINGSNVSSEGFNYLVDYLEGSFFWD